jgi:Sporulation protein and related proteins
MPPTSRSVASARILLSAATALVIAATAAPVAQADDAVTPVASTITITGAGWGHGRGMSQYGAYGAAKKGLSYSGILSFYYPGTVLSDVTGSSTIRVWISADNDNRLHFRSVKGLQVYDTSGHKVNLPTGSKYTNWRIARSGTTSVLAYRNTAGKYVTYKTSLNPTQVWRVKNTSTGTIKLGMPDYTTRVYSGVMALRFYGTGARIVNELPMETYLRSVVPSEMPAGWGSTANKGIEALKAQSVAARTYAARLRASRPSSAVYDLCDTSSCQVYKDSSNRYSQTDTAIKATAGKVITYSGALALTEYTSSNGGLTAASNLAYQVAQLDPYESYLSSVSSWTSAWTKTIKTSVVEAAYPTIGTLQSIQVTARTGGEPFGGRVSSVKLVGSLKTVTVTGSAFKSKFSLRETLFSISTPAPVATTTKKK